MSISRLSFLCFLVLLLVFNIPSSGQIWKKVLPTKDTSAATKLANEITEKQLRADVTYLASDNLEGRLSGSKGEMLAGTYVQKRFTEMGLLPYGKSYTRSFKFEKGSELSSDVRFSINSKYISVPEDALPANYSIGGKDENYVLPESKEANSPWVIGLYESEQDAKNPNFNWEAESYKRAKFAMEHGATSVLFYDAFGSKYFPSYKNLVFSGEKLNIPVMLLGKKCYDISIANMRVMQPILVNIAYKQILKSGTNVLAVINNNASQTVIIGAHYDHIGNGADFIDNKEHQPKVIHNGANDNASGVAAMLALAAKIKSSPNKKFNYLFIAFSGEEFGAAGSKAFVKASDFVKSDIAYMVNFDMVGRLVNRQLWVNGVGSSLSWNSVLSSIYSNLKLVKDSVVMPPSDESSFYNVEVPILSFSSGMNTDYHLPSDDISKLNFVGTREIVNYVFELTREMEAEPIPLFTTYQAAKSYQDENEKASLGILPDYKFTSGGIKVGSVIVNKPASKAGILEGDIILQVANYPITDVKSYKDAISKFKGGDQIKVRLKRNRVLIDLTVNF